MDTTANTHLIAPKPLLSVPARIVAVIAVAIAILLASLGAEQASHQAVQNAAQAFSQSTKHVRLSTVEVVGRRDTGDTKRM